MLDRDRIVSIGALGEIYIGGMGVGRGYWHRAESTAERFAFISPRSGLERASADIWVELLLVDRVEVQDNFFEPGGHSLLATRLISLISDQLGVDPPVSAIFAAPAVEQLSARMSAGAYRREEDDADWVRNVAPTLRHSIDQISDADVLSRIRELEKELIRRLQEMKQRVYLQNVRIVVRPIGRAEVSSLS